MSVFARMVNLTKAAAHELLEKLEDPVMMMNQYVRNMQDEIEQLQNEKVKQEATARGLKTQLEESTRLANMYEEKALEALANNREAEAREALSTKLHYAEKSVSYQEWHSAAVSRSAELAHRLEEAKVELEALQKKRTELTARVKQAAVQSRQTMPSFSMGANLDGGSAARGFQRIEEKIMQWEAHLELAGQAPFTPPYGSGYGAQAGTAATADPAKSALIDEQLEQLRKKLPAE
ncbi:PspA/IM30 family protein [Paenibacillus sp. GCM10027626]|uniref:PspA/IM30 family protein n=1 Tax=Paenibacillus sp. GCM10027626 TaxID=3273411 RepID=UPI003633DA6E